MGAGAGVGLLLGVWGTGASPLAFRARARARRSISPVLMTTIPPATRWADISSSRCTEPRKAAAASTPPNVPPRNARMRPSGRTTKLSRMVRTRVPPSHAPRRRASGVDTDSTNAVHEVHSTANASVPLPPRVPAGAPARPNARTTRVVMVLSIIAIPFHSRRRRGRRWCPGALPPSPCHRAAGRVASVQHARIRPNSHDLAGHIYRGSRWVR